MKRFTRVDRFLLFVLVPIWVTAFVFHIKQVAFGHLTWVGVFVSSPSDPDGYPVVSGFWPGLNAEVSGLLPGDRLLQAGTADLKGVGPVGFVARVEHEADDESMVRLIYERHGAAASAELKLSAATYPWRIAPFAAVLVFTGVVVLLRASPAPIGRAFFLAATAYAAQWTFFPGGPVMQTYIWAALFGLASLVALPLSLRAALLFAPEVDREGGLPWWPWMFAVFGPAAFSWVFGTPLPPPYGQQAAFIINVLFIVTFLGVITHSYRTAGAIGRRQLKWALVGLYVGLAPMLTIDAVAAAEPSLSWLHDVAAIFLVAIPLSLLVGIVRFNLFDVDRVIATTAVYSILSFIFLAATFTLVPAASRLGASALGLDTRTSTVILSALLASGAVPTQRIFQPYVERTFFVESHALRLGIETLLRELTLQGDASSLIDLAHSRLANLLQPQVCAAYVRDDATFVCRQEAQPVAAFDSGSPLIEAARRSAGPLDGQGRRRARRSPRLAARVSQALDSLGVSVVLPVRRGEELVALILLGPKRSGDVYTDTDLALLGVLASQLSNELVRLEVQRYAPRDVLRVLRTDPRALEPRLHDVTILFSDIRGATAIAEELPAAAWLRLQDRYFESMADVVQRHQGVFIKTIGDAVMALWNAPVRIDDHGTQGCSAALEMLEVLRQLNLDWNAEGWPAIDIRIGLHTGETMVGNFGTGELIEYDARGDAVNLASRLEGLNKEYGSRLLISDSTRELLRTEFICRELDRVRVVGRAQPVTVYQLLGLAPKDESRKLQRLEELFAEALTAYKARRWDEAVSRFEAVAGEFPGDPPTLRYLERCRTLRIDPPAPDWDGVFDARSK